jgi:hypothetical protein
LISVASGFYGFGNTSGTRFTGQFVSHASHLAPNGLTKKAVNANRGDSDQGDNDDVLGHALTQLAFFCADAVHGGFLKLDI